MWLLVGFTRKEIHEHGYKVPCARYVTLDRGDYGPYRKDDIDFKDDAFDPATWRRILCAFGHKSFDCIFTDGGMHGYRRVNEIVEIKRLLLKDNGYIVNFTSPIGKMIRCPLGRPFQFYAIPKGEYTISNFDSAYARLEQAPQERNFGNAMRAKMRMVI